MILEVKTDIINLSELKYNENEKENNNHVHNLCIFIVKDAKETHKSLKYNEISIYEFQVDVRFQILQGKIFIVQC